MNIGFSFGPQEGEALRWSIVSAPIESRINDRWPAFSFWGQKSFAELKWLAYRPYHNSLEYIEQIEARRELARWWKLCAQFGVFI